MPAPHPFPVPPALLIQACDRVERRLGRLPFPAGGSEVTDSLVAAALEALNAEASRTLALRHRLADDGRVLVDGLDRHLAGRGFPDKGMAAAVADVLVQAGIAQKSSVVDRRSRRFVRGIRLLPPWTWTIVTAGRDPSPPRVKPGETDPAALRWTDLCPVCRAGRLDPVTGEDLFGMTETDFLACTACGARFVPDNGRFRLVSIGKRQDPFRAKLLNRSCAPGEWQSVAQSGSSAGGPPGRAGREGEGRQKSRFSGGLDSGHSLTVELENRTLYFRAYPLVFVQQGIRDLFVRYREPVLAVLERPAYRHLAQIIQQRYPHYFDLPAGPVVRDLQRQGNFLYTQFLNPYGGGTFCTFRGNSPEFSGLRGVFVIAGQGTLLAAGRAPDSFGRTVNETLGAVTPQDCYLDGDTERCRINSLLCRRNGRAGLFVHPLDNGDEISRTAALLAARLPAAGPGPGPDPAGWV